MRVKFQIDLEVAPIDDESEQEVLDNVLEELKDICLETLKENGRKPTYSSAQTAGQVMMISKKDGE